MKSFEELLESLPQENQLSAEEQEKILGLVMQRIEKKPMRVKKWTWRAASLVAACLILVAVLAMPLVTQKKNMQQEGFVAGGSANFMSMASDDSNAVKMESAESSAQADVKSQEEAAEKIETEEEETDVILRGEDMNLPMNAGESYAKEEIMMDSVALEEEQMQNSPHAAPELSEEAPMDSVAPKEEQMQNSTYAVPEVSEDKSIETTSEKIETEASPTVNADDAVPPDSVAQKPQSSSSGGGGGSSSVVVEVITDNETYRSVKRTAGGTVSFENTYKPTNRTLSLKDLFPSGYDYKKELSLTGTERFYITPDNHLMILHVSGKIDVGVLTDGKIQK